MIQKLTSLDKDRLDEFLEHEMLDQRQLPTEAVKAATTILTIGPIVLVYPFIQKYFIKGIFVGSLKG